MTSVTARLGLLLLAMCALAACGGAAAYGPRDAGADEPRTPESALAALDQAERELALVLGVPAGYAQPAQPSGGIRGDAVGGARGEEKPSAAPPPPPASPPAPVEQAQRPADAPSVTTAAKSDPCATACRALASMKRAAEHVCELAGAGDARCGAARDRVKNASARVHASCPACGAAAP